MTFNRFLGNNIFKFSFLNSRFHRIRLCFQHKNKIVPRRKGRSFLRFSFIFNRIPMLFFNEFMFLLCFLQDEQCFLIMFKDPRSLGLRLFFHRFPRDTSNRTKRTRIFRRNKAVSIGNNRSNTISFLIGREIPGSTTRTFGFVTRRFSLRRIFGSIFFHRNRLLMRFKPLFKVLNHRLYSSKRRARTSLVNHSKATISYNNGPISSPLKLGAKYQHFIQESTLKFI